MTGFWQFWSQQRTESLTSNNFAGIILPRCNAVWQDGNSMGGFSSVQERRPEYDGWLYLTQCPDRHLGTLGIRQSSCITSYQAYWKIPASVPVIIYIVFRLQRMKGMLCFDIRLQVPAVSPCNIVSRLCCSALLSVSLSLIPLSSHIKRELLGQLNNAYGAHNQLIMK